MAGVRIELSHTHITAALNQAVNSLHNPAPLFQNIIEYLTRIHRQRFTDQVSPDGQAWQALSPAYLKRKRKNKDKVLSLNGYLRNTLRGQYTDSEIEFGTDRTYGAIHQFGGDINIPARSQQAYFKQGRNGQVGNRFVKKKNSNFAQWTTIQAHAIKMPARPWLGTSTADDDYILALTKNYIERYLQ